MTEEIAPFIDDPTIREVYVELVQTLFGSAGTLRIELGTTRWSQDAPVRIVRRVPVARFAIGYSAAKDLRDQLSRCLELAEKQAQLEQIPASPTKN